MKRKILRMLTLALSCVMILSITATAFATSTRASAYFALTDAWTTPTGNGSFIVEFDVTTTHIMQEVGASKIMIWEQQSNGTYSNVKTFTSDNTSGLIDTNESCAYASVTYRGKSGTKYYTTVVFYAKDSKGSEKIYHDTAVFTA